MSMMDLDVRFKCIRFDPLLEVGNIVITIYQLKKLKTQKPVIWVLLIEIDP